MIIMFMGGHHKLSVVQRMVDQRKFYLSIHVCKIYSCKDMKGPFNDCILVTWDRVPNKSQQDLSAAQNGFECVSRGLHLANKSLLLPQRYFTMSARVVGLPITAIRGLK